MAASAASQQQRTARTFEDIARQPASRGPLTVRQEQAPEAGCSDCVRLHPTQHGQEPRAIAPLPPKQDRPPADFLPPCLAPSLHPDATNLTLLVEPGAERRLAPSPSPPLDWSLKTTARFSSPSPFSVVEEALGASGGEAVAAQRTFAGGLGTGCLSLRQQLLAALLSFQFPQDPQPPFGGGSGSAGRPRSAGPAPLQLARRQAWQSALCSLYDAFRCGRCDAFYCVSPEGSRRPFVAFFGAAGLAGRRRLHGLLTRTTAGLRALLGRDGCGLITPLMPDVRAASEDLVSSAVSGGG